MADVPGNTSYSGPSNAKPLATGTAYVPGLRCLLRTAIPTISLIHTLNTFFYVPGTIIDAGLRAMRKTDNEKA